MRKRHLQAAAAACKIMSKYLTPITVIIASLMIGGVVFYIQKSQTREVLPGTKNEHIIGNSEAEVTIIEFSDFQCLYCGVFHPTVKQILEDYPERVRLVYKHFPLDQIHPQARPAAEASECVFEQKGNDSFWEFSDGLFENQSRLGKDLYRELAEKVGLSMDQFEECIASRKYKTNIEADYQEGIKAGVRGTPASFVNGELVSGAVPYETLKAAIERAFSNL